MECDAQGSGLGTTRFPDDAPKEHGSKHVIRTHAVQSLISMRRFMASCQNFSDPYRIISPSRLQLPMHDWKSIERGTCRPADFRILSIRPAFDLRPKRVATEIRDFEGNMKATKDRRSGSSISITIATVGQTTDALKKHRDFQVLFWGN